MNPYELREKQYDWRNQRYGPSGLEWLELFKKHFPYLIWLNPEPLPAFQDFWTLTHLQLAKMFPMFDLSAEGLEARHEAPYGEAISETGPQHRGQNK